MSNMLELNCWVIGDDPGRVILVEVPSSKTVGYLKKEIKNEIEHSFPDFKFDAKSLDLWKVNIDLTTHSDLLKSIKVEDEIPDGKELKPWSRLSKLFVDGAEDEHLHTIMQRPTDTVKLNHERSFNEEEGDIITEMVNRYGATVLKATNADTPSKSAKSTGYRMYQRNLPIYDGRYDVDCPISTTAPPIQLFHPVFGHFLDDIADEKLDVPQETVRATACFMAAASGIYEKEDHRKPAIFPHLAEALSTGMTKKIVNSDLTSPDGAVSLPLVGDIYETVSPLLAEDKREVGEGGSDPSTQVGLSMARFWAQDNHRVVRDNTCCPTFLLASGGPWLTVLGAIFTDKVVVQRLTDFIWVGTDTILNERHCYRVARILYSLGRGIRKLNEYYVGVKPDSIGKPELHSRYFPSIRAYRDASGAIVDFAYVKPLERDATCVTFLAKTFEASPKSIVVKFVERYGVAAHKLLEKMDAAPQLLYYGKISASDDNPTYGHLRMVVMEYLDGMTGNQAQKLDQLPPTFLDDVQTILSHLHDNDLVFGDVRSANIMITRNHKVKFVDFDWAGKAGVSRYPLLLSQQIQWPDGVGDGLAVMEKQHDLDMLTRLV